MTLRLIEHVDAGEAVGSEAGRLRVREPGAHPPLAALDADEVRNARALHLWCRDPDDLDEIREIDPMRFGYVAVALGRGLESAERRDALLGALEDIGALVTTPVLWHTARGSIGQNLVVVRDALRERPRLRVALDYPEVYGADEMLLGRYGRWSDVLDEIGRRTTTLIVGDGDSERDPLAAPHEGLTSVPLRLLYARRQRRLLASVAPVFVSWRTRRADRGGHHPTADRFA